MRIRIVLISIILFLDIFLLPVVFRLPGYIKSQGIGPAPRALAVEFKDRPLMGVTGLITQKDIRAGWLWSQFFIAGLILAVLWRPERQKRRYKIGKNLGGPEAVGSGEYGTSRWRMESETDKTFTIWHTDRLPAVGGFVLGAVKKGRGKLKVWLDASEAHVLLIGITGAGKSRKIFMPSIWEIGKTGESMVITDPKGELCDTTGDYLLRQGYEVIRLDFREPLRGQRWNPLYPVIQAIKEGDYDRATDYAVKVAYTLVSSRSGDKGEPIWRDGAEALLASIILAVCDGADIDEQKHLSSVYRTIGELSEPDPDTGIIPLNEYINGLPGDHPAKRAFYPAKTAPYRMRGSFFTQVLTTLRLFDSASMRCLTSDQDFDLGLVGKRPAAVFMVIPDEASENHVCASIAIDQIYQALVDVAINNGGKLLNRVHFLLDEFGNLPKIKDFEQKVTVARSRNIKFTLAVQGLNQLKKFYRDEADTITGNCSIWAYMGTKDPETERVISNMTGKYTISTDSYSSSSNRGGVSTTRGEGKTGRALLMPDEVGRWDVDHLLILQVRELPTRLPLLDVSQWPASPDLYWGRKEAGKARVIPDIPVWIPEVKKAGKPKTTKERDDNKPDSEKDFVVEPTVSVQDIEDF